MLMFAVAALSFTIAIVAGHIWVLCQILLRLLDRQWLRAAWWGFVLIALLYVDATVLASMDLS
jgi:hypothetical protein